MDKRKLEKIENDNMLASDKVRALLYEIERMNDNILSLAEEVKKKELSEYELELDPQDFKGIDGKDANEESIINAVLSKIPKSIDGYTPIKGIDYFTPYELQEIKKELRPVKGIDYPDSIDREDTIYVGKNPPENARKGMIWYEED